MNYIKYSGCILLAWSLLFLTSCEDSEPSVPFGPDQETITIGPEGGLHSIKVSSSAEWSATTNEPWLLISPANGQGTGDCRIRVDSTYQNEARTGHIYFSTSNSKPRAVTINQMGFENQILVKGAVNGSREINIPDFAQYGTNFFEVEVTTNVNFRIVIEDHTEVPQEGKLREGASPRAKYADWISYDRLNKWGDILEASKAKPRTFKIRFDWRFNTKWWSQNAVIRFVPVEYGMELSKAETVTVRQDAAPRINYNRAGDSIAVLAIARQLNSHNEGFDSSKPMEEWGEDIELYTRADGNDKWGRPLEGRVKYVRFYFIESEVEIPYEVRYLTRCEHMSFFSNINSQAKSLEMGESLMELADSGYLKKLEIFAYGLTKLPYSFKKLGKCGPEGKDGLEYLSLSNNNLTEFPKMLTKENFPYLKHLNMVGCRRYSVHDLSNSIYEGREGLGAKPQPDGNGEPLPYHLFTWDTLEELELSYNYFCGSLPDMNDYPIKWSEEDGYPELAEKGIPKILPNLKHLKINLNRLSGELPEWLLRHPNLKEWDPYVLIFPQDGKDRLGQKAGFTNEPDQIIPPVKE